MAELQEVDPVPYEAIAWVHVVGWVTRPCAKDYPTAASQVQVGRQIAARRQRQQLADAGYPRKTGVGEPNHWRSGDSASRRTRREPGKSTMPSGRNPMTSVVEALAQPVGQRL